MRNVIVILVVINTLLLLTIFLMKIQGSKPHDLIEGGIPSLTVLPEVAISRYTADIAPHDSSCFTIGPYYSEKAAQLVAGRIRSSGLAVVIRSMNSKETLSYLVYIANVSSHEAAVEMTLELKKQNVGKFDIIASGPYKNTITFGFYKNLDRAKRKSEYIRYLGYDAKYNGQKVTRKIYWIDYDEPLGKATPALLWSQSIDPSSNVQIIPRNCDQRAWYGSGAFANSF